MRSVDEFDVGQVLGRGGFGLVHRARHRATGRDVALKILDKTRMEESRMTARVVNEVSLHAGLRHPHIVDLLGFFEDEQSVYLVMELCTRGDLYRYLKRNGPLREEEAAVLVAQVLDALGYLHAQHIMHRDLKLSNLLLTGDLCLKISDFGLAVKLQSPDEEHFTLCGTPNYIAPEVATEGSAYSLPADLWSVGCLLHTLVAGRAPFQCQGTQVPAAQAELLADYQPPAGLSPHALDFLRCLLQTDPDHRHDVHAILAHPFLSAVVPQESKQRPRPSLKHTSPHLAPPAAAFPPPASLAPPCLPQQQHAHGGAGKSESGAGPRRAAKYLSRAAPGKFPPVLEHQPSPSSCSSRRSMVTVPAHAHAPSLCGLSTNTSAETPGPSTSSTPSPPPPLPHPRTGRKRGLSTCSSKSASRPPASPSLPPSPLETCRLAPFKFNLPCGSLSLKPDGSLLLRLRDRGLALKVSRQGLRVEVKYTQCRRSPPTEQTKLVAHSRHDQGQYLPHARQHQRQQYGYERLQYDGRHRHSAGSAQQGGADGDVVWREYSLAELPRELRPAYVYAKKLVEGIRCKTPRTTLFLFGEKGAKDVAIAKCMLMENTPMPDFRVRWSDGTTLLYSLHTGTLKLRIGHGPDKGALHEWCMPTDGSVGVTMWGACGTQPLAGYLQQAQEAMSRCLELGLAANNKRVFYEKIQLSVPQSSETNTEPRAHLSQHHVCATPSRAAPHPRATNHDACSSPSSTQVVGGDESVTQCSRSSSGSHRSRVSRRQRKEEPRQPQPPHTDHTHEPIHATRVQGHSCRRGDDGRSGQRATASDDSSGQSRRQHVPCYATVGEDQRSSWSGVADGDGEGGECRFAVIEGVGRGRRTASGDVEVVFDDGSALRLDKGGGRLVYRPDDGAAEEVYDLLPHPEMIPRRVRDQMKHLGRIIQALKLG